jgi:dUTP pyrophosphatase
LVSTPKAPRIELRVRSRLADFVQPVQVTVRVLDRNVSPPARAHEGDAGLDLQARQAVVLEPGERVSVPTGIAVAIPTGYAGLVLPRSGHARRSGVSLVNSPGLIDSGYRGEIEVLLINHGHEPVRFEAGDRIAQLMIVEVPTVTWLQSEALPDSARGERGFGSTGR